MIRAWLQKNNAPVSILHFAPQRGLTHRLRNMRDIIYRTTDLCAPGVDVHVDITQLPFEPDAFECVICSHVLEHIPNDAAAISEIHRVLTRPGIAFVQVPYVGSRLTDEDPGVTDSKERLRRFGQTDHVRMYGYDLVDRLQEPGFDVESRFAGAMLNEAEMCRFGLWNLPTFVCYKL